MYFIKFYIKIFSLKNSIFKINFNKIQNHIKLLYFYSFYNFGNLI